LRNEAAIELMPLEEKVMAKEPIRQDTIKRYKLKAYKQLRDQFGYPG